MGDNIKVAVRVRPLLQKEISNGLSMLWKIKNNAITAHDSTTAADNYVFDSVYDHMDTNGELYEGLCSPIIKSAMAGFHGTIFAYGQSGSGKTHTMTGNKMQAGVIDQAVDEIFDIIDSESVKKEFLLRISYMEIYTERIFDLFDDAEKTLKIQEDTNHQISVVNLTEQIVNSKKQLLQWMIRGETKRKFAETKANDRSSRSHVILRLIIESRLKGDVDAVMVSHLNFVDLAGSEKAADNSGDRFREGCAINRSLLTLSQVISKLSEGVGNAYIGYRDSKLTRILQNALGGNSNTLIICTISPSSMDESISTLRFASRAKTIKNKPMRNEVLSDSALLKKYAMQIKKLQRLVDDTGVHDIKLEKEDLENKLKEKEIYQQEQDELINKLRTMLVVSATHKDSADAKQKKQRRETWCGPKLRNSSGKEMLRVPQGRLIFRESGISTVFHDFAIPRQPLSLMESDMSTSAREPLSSRHRSFPVLEEEEDVSFVDPPLPILNVDEEDSIFLPPDSTRRSFVTNSRRSGRKSELEKSVKVSEMEKLKSENEDLQEENTKLGKRVMELESCNEMLDNNMAVLKEKLSQMQEDITLQSLELDRAYGLARHEMSIRELQEFHRLEKEELEDQIETLVKKKADLESVMVPADAQYVKQLEQELASNYDKVVELNKNNKDMETQIAKLKKELHLSKGEVDRKLHTNDDYIMMLEKQVNTSQEKLKGYERMSVGAIPAGTQVNSSLEATIESLVKDKAKLEVLLEAKSAEVAHISEEKQTLRTSLDNKITEVENLMRSEERRSLTSSLEKQASDEAVLTEAESELAELKVKVQDAETYAQEKQIFEKMLADKDAELDALVEKFQSVTSETSRQVELIDEMKALNEKILTEKIDVEKQLLDSKQQMEVIIAEKMEIEDKLCDVERIVVDKATLEEQLKEKVKEIETLLAEKEEILNLKKESVLERSQRMSQSDVIIHSIDADITVDLSGKMFNISKGPVSLADELAGVSQPMSLADELAGVSQPMSLADELAGVSQPMSLADELAVFSQPMSLADELAGVSQPMSLADELACASEQKPESLADALAVTSSTSSSTDQIANSEEVSVDSNRTTKDEELQTSFEQKGEIPEYEEQLKSKSEEIDKVLEAVRNLESQLKIKETEVQNLTITKSKLEQQLEEKQEELETFSNEMMRLQDLVEETQEKRIFTEQDMRENKEALEDQKMTTRKLQEELDMKNEQITSMQAMDAGYVCDDDQKKRLAALEMEIVDQKEELQTALKEKKEIELKVETLQASLEEEASRKEEKDSIPSRVKELEECVSKKEKHLEKIKIQYDDREAEILRLTESLEQRKTNIEESHMENLLTKINELEINLDKKTQQFEHVKKELEVREACIKELQQLGEQCEEDEISFATRETVMQEDVIQIQPAVESSEQTAENKDLQSQENSDAGDQVSFANKDTAACEVKDVEGSSNIYVDEEHVSSDRNSTNIEDLEAKVTELESTLRGKAALLEEAQIQYEEQEMKIKTIQQSFEENNQQMYKLQTNIKNLEISLQDKESDLEQMRAEKQKYLDKVLELQHQISEKKDNTLDENDAKIDDLFKKVEELQNLLQEKEEEITKTKNELFQFQETVQSLKEELEASGTAKSSQETEIKELFEKTESLESSIAEKDFEAEKDNKLQVELLEAVQRYKDELDMKVREMSSLNNKIDHLEFCIAEKESESGEKFEAVEEMKNKLDTLKQEISTKEEKVNEMTGKVTKLENNLEEKELDVEAKSKQIEEMIEEIAQGKVELEAKVKEAALLEERVLEVEEQLNQQETDFENIKEAGMAKINALTEESLDLQDKNMDLENCLKEKEAELVEITAQIEQVFEEKLQESKLEVQAKESEQRALVEKISVLEEALKEKDVEIERVLSEKVKLEEGGEEMMRLVQEKHELEEKLRAKTTEAVTLMEDKSQVELDLNHKSSELQIMVDFKNKQDTEMEEKITEIENLSNEILKLEDAVVEKTQEIELLQEEKTSTESLLKEKSALLEDLGQKMNEFENLYQEKSDEVDQCRLEIETLMKTCATLEEQLHKARNDNSSEEKLQNEVDTLQRIQQEKDEEIFKLQSEIEKLNNRQVNLSTCDMQPKTADEATTQKMLLTQLFAKLNKSGKSNLTDIIETLEKEGHNLLANNLREQDVKLAKEKLEVEKRINILELQLGKKDKELDKKEDVAQGLYKTMMESEEKITSLEEEMESVKEEMKKIELSKVDLNLEVHYLRNKMKEEQDHHKQRRTALDEEIEYKTEVISRLKGEMRKLQQNQETSFVAPPQAEPAPAAPQVSSRSGIIDHYKVCILEGEKKEMQQRIRELRKRVQTLMVEVNELKEQNAELKKTPKTINDKENGPITPKNVKPEKGKATPEPDFSLDFLKKRRSLTYEEVKKMAAPYKEKRSTALSPIKDSSRVNEMAPSVASVLETSRLSQRRSLSKESAENCKVQ